VGRCRDSRRGGKRVSSSLAAGSSSSPKTRRLLGSDPPRDGGHAGPQIDRPLATIAKYDAVPYETLSYQVPMRSTTLAGVQPSGRFWSISMAPATSLPLQVPRAPPRHAFGASSRIWRAASRIVSQGTSSSVWSLPGEAHGHGRRVGDVRGHNLLAAVLRGRCPAARVALIFIALTAPVAPACRVTPSARTKIPAVRMSSALDPSIRIPSRPSR
jgi:hypothetical protein